MAFTSNKYWYDSGTKAGPTTAQCAGVGAALKNQNNNKTNTMLMWHLRQFKTIILEIIVTILLPTNSNRADKFCNSDNLRRKKCSF
jgi:hypothetical protein